jgi:hypothetical protein
MLAAVRRIAVDGCAVVCLVLFLLVPDHPLLMLSISSAYVDCEENLEGRNPKGPMKRSNLLRICGGTLLACCLGCCQADTVLCGEDPSRATPRATEPAIRPTLLWGAAQLVPSPQWSLLAHDGLRFGLRWQVTPVLYCFGINRKLSPWRWFVVEPFVRQVGSLEIFCSPEYASLKELDNARWSFRTGLRGYIPILEHGEYLSASLASSFFVLGGKRGTSYETGLYFFAGIVGVQTTYSPSLSEAPWIFTLRLRYF